LNKILITGGAGFIGSILADKLLSSGEWELTIIDNFDPFYDINIKKQNIRANLKNKHYHFIEADITDYSEIKSKLNHGFDVIIHLAAKAGVRPSIKDPIAYQQVNIQGTQNILEFARLHGIKQFIFGSSSSIYGINSNVPWKEDDSVLKPISPYAATKLSAELLGHVYTNLYGIRFLALRFFTVYGPRQRPDLAIHKFCKKILKDKAIQVYGDGSTMRDYTYVDDIISGLINAIEYQNSVYEIINLGNNKTISLKELIKTIEGILERKAIVEKLPEQPGDVPLTYADIDKAKCLLNYDPSTNLSDGIKEFIKWFRKLNY
jgi:UDP-glucuronate 4-epimerase